MGQGGGTLFSIAQMSQKSIDDILVLDAPVRRIGNDPDGTTAAAANLNVDIENSLESLGPGHGGMTWADERTSVLARGFTALPRLAGVTSPRQRWLGRAAQVREHRDSGTGRPRSLNPWLRYEGCQAGDEIDRIEGHLGRPIPVGCLLPRAFKE